MKYKNSIIKTASKQ